MALRRRCHRHVRVAEFTAMEQQQQLCRSIRTGIHTANLLNVHHGLRFAGLVEILYAHTVWLAVRVDIWTSNTMWHCQVKCLNVYLHRGLYDDDQVDCSIRARLQDEKWLTTVQSVAKVAMNVSDWSDVTTVTADELTADVLTPVVLKVVEEFKALQMQTLQMSASERAKVEYELVQHLPELEIVVVKRQRSGDCYVLFALPLLGEIVPWDPKALLAKGEVDSVYIPDGFNAPNFSDTTDRPTVFSGYSMKSEENSDLDHTWPLVVEWPAELQLSSQVTQTPVTSEAISFLELVASCRKKFLEQWRRRKDFIAELRRRVIVLEYDAVDFSQVFFMLQEQLDVRALLRIMVVRLEFTTTYFFTNCMSDLRVTLLSGDDGVSPVVVALDASSTRHNSDDVTDSQACVTQFLEFTQKGLLQHFYGH